MLKPSLLTPESFEQEPLNEKNNDFLSPAPLPSKPDFPSKLEASVQEAWTRTCQRLRSELGNDIFNSWFGRLDLENIQETRAYLSVPTRFLKSWIEAHYSERILFVLASELPAVKSLVLEVRLSTAPLPARTSPSAASLFPKKSDSPAGHLLENNRTYFKDSVSGGSLSPVVADSRNLLTSSPLDARLTFENFITGPSNQLAHAAAMNVVQSQEDSALLYSPLYIHSAVGLGKTHLLHSVAQAVEIQQKRVIYLTAEKFMYGFVTALKAQTAIDFKEKLRTIDILIIDDVQFLQGKSIQHEFCHTMNALIDARKQIVIAADRAPADLAALEDRVRSRLAGGLCVKIHELEESLRERILESRIQAARNNHKNFKVPTAVISYVARVITTNGRDLEGAVNRLLAHATFSGSPLTIETAETAIRDLIRNRESKRIKIEDIQKLVATHYNVTKAELLSERRTAVIVRPRQVAMFIAKMLTPRSLPEIGRRFGGRDHTTVLHAIRKIENLLTKDKNLSEEIELLKRLLMDS